MATAQGLDALSARPALNLLLGVAVAATAAIWWLGRPLPQQAPVGHRLTALEVDNVRSIEVHRRGATGIVLRRVGQGWRMERPYAARAGAVPVERLLELVRTSATARFPAEDLARFELDRPWARVVLNDVSLDFGATNTVTRDLYVAAGGHVHAVAATTGAAIPGNAASLLDRRLLAPGEEPAAFELPGFAVALDGTRWARTPPASDLSQDDLQHWVEQWRTATSIVTRPAASAAISASVKLQLRDGRAIEISVVERAPSFVLRRIDESLDYELPPALGAALLAGPGGGERPAGERRRAHP